MFKKYSSVIVTGSMAYDDIMDFPGFFKDYLHPDKLHQINVSFVLDKIEKQIGGTGTNIAYNLKLVLGGDKVPVILLGAVGKDGQEFIRFLKKNRCDTKGIIVDKKLYTATGKVITDKNDNQIWGFYYGASQTASKHQLKKYADSDSLVFISANHPKAFLHFQKQAIAGEYDYFYDPGMSLTWITDRDLKEGVLNSKFLVGNDYEIAMICKRLRIDVKNLVKKAINVVTTLGGKGVCYEYSEKNLYKKIVVPAFPVRNVLDPTGAGDAWRAGFTAGIIKNCSLTDCLKLGNVMASFAIETYGTVNHHPDQKAITDRSLLISA